MNATKKQTVLIVDDLRTSTLALAKILEPEWHVQTVSDGPGALSMASGDPAPDIILLDIKMPNMDGYEVCKRLKESPKTRDIPVIFITAMDDAEDEAYGMELGAVDYIIKPVKAPVVRARVRNHLALRRAHAKMAEARTELARRNRKLEHLAARDKLTNLYNRWKLDERFALEILRAERYDRPLSIIILDLDHFKTVNDTHGHPAGDLVLAETAARMQANLRKSDVLGRWGGEEFLIICPETDIDTAMKLAERLRAACETRDFPVTGPLTASFGVATHRQGRRAKEILLAADIAMYRAKNTGRNRVEKELQYDETQ